MATVFHMFVKKGLILQAGRFRLTARPQNTFLFAHSSLAVLRRPGCTEYVYQHSKYEELAEEPSVLWYISDPHSAFPQPFPRGIQFNSRPQRSIHVDFTKFPCVSTRENLNSVLKPAYQTCLLISQIMHC